MAEWQEHSVVDDTVMKLMDGTSLAARLSEREIRDVVRAGQQVTIPEGWSFIWEQTPGDAAYLLLEGRVAVFYEREQVAELGPGDIVGETALRERRLRTATVSALTPLIMLRFSIDAFAELSSRVPKFTEAVDANVAERLHRKSGEEPGDGNG